MRGGECVVGKEALEEEGAEGGGWESQLEREDVGLRSGTEDIVGYWIGGARGLGEERDAAT